MCVYATPKQLKQTGCEEIGTRVPSYIVNRSELICNTGYSCCNYGLILIINARQRSWTTIRLENSCKTCLERRLTMDTMNVFNDIAAITRKSLMPVRNLSWSASSFSVLSRSSGLCSSSSVFSVWVFDWIERVSAIWNPNTFRDIFFYLSLKVSFCLILEK